MNPIVQKLLHRLAVVLLIVAAWMMFASDGPNNPPEPTFCQPSTCDARVWRLIEGTDHAEDRQAPD